MKNRFRCSAGASRDSLRRAFPVSLLAPYAFHFSLLVIAATLAVMVNFPDWDLWARLAVGSIVLQTGGVLKQDIFAYTPTKPLWVDHEWGSGVVFSLLVRHFGETGLFVFKGALIFALLVAVSETIKLRAGGKSPVGTLYFVFLGLGLIYSVNHTIRSQMFTFVFFAAWVYLLERVRRGDTWPAWVIPVSTVLWANLHGGFLAGLGLIVIYGGGEYFNHRDPRAYARMFAGSLLATLVNPYGVKLWTFLVEAVLQPRPLIMEWAPFSLSGPYNGVLGVQYHAHIAFIVFAVLLVPVGLKGLIAAGRPDWVKILLAASTLYLGIRHQRHTVFFIIVAAGLLADQYTALLTRTLAILAVPLRLRVATAMKALERVVSATIVAWLVVVLARDLSASQARLTINPQLYPVGSFEFIRLNRIGGNLAVTFNWGSYALWKLYPQCRVMIDGRFEEVYPYSVYLLALDYSEHQTRNWHRIVQVFPADIAVLPKAAYSSFDLAALPGWQRVYEDAVSVVLLPSNRVRRDYRYPDPSDRNLLHDDFSRPVDLSRREAAGKR